jgi:UDP-2,4-diacetamido-2,4,6-trideoxy-beta-L-altropyranose hydrolase
VDASYNIGTGHVMRCLALANEAKHQDWECTFVLRDPDDEIIRYITSFSHRVEKLMSIDGEKITCNSTAHGDWLPVSQIQDANETVEVICELDPDWIIVDHYALDATWLSIVEKSNDKMLVIDDLGDRELICDVLLDQNLGASAEKYHGKLPSNCQLLLGPTFALLRSEFKDWRERSLEGRLHRNVENILITMGGADADNYTLQTLIEVAKIEYAKKCVFTVIIGSSYPHTDALHEFVEETKLRISVLSNVKNMAEIMSKSDLCIGAGGSTSWERCCLGLPTISFAIADNQIGVLAELEKNKCTIISSLERISLDFEKLISEEHSQQLKKLSLNSSKVTDGNGIKLLLERLDQPFD